MKSLKVLVKTSLVVLVLQLIPSLLLGQNQRNAVTPGERWGHAFIYDQKNDQILLFGGSASSGKYFGDTWVWAGGSWKKFNVSGPEPRGFSAITYHEGLNTILLHGGRGNNGETYSDLWGWDGSRWTELETVSEFKADHHEMVYVPGSRQVIAFGGWNGENVLGTTWIWDGDWKVHDGISPPKRSAFGMTLDRLNEKIVLYGGLWINGQYADLWEWKKGNWEVIGGPYDRSTLDHHSLMYDEKRQQVMGFGGKNYRYVPRQETFVIRDSNLDVLLHDGPAARHSIGFTYDRKSGYGYLYGGKFYKDGEQLPMGDFWRWDGLQWALVK